jgi:uncharacterized protein (DUF362 family)
MSTVAVVKFREFDPDKKAGKDDYRHLLETGFSVMGKMAKPEKYLARMFSGERIGMKTNCLAGRLNSTSVALTEALTGLLADSGIDESDITIWERTNRELTSAGFTLNASSFGKKVIGTDSNDIGYGRTFYSSGEVNSLLSRIMTDMIDINVNLPILKDHSIAGLSGGLKNMYGAIHNPNKFHDNNCDPFAAHVSNLEPIRSKNRLVIMDAVKVQYNGGPGFDSRYFEPYGAVLISEDPVAVDRVGLEILEQLREKHGLPPLEKVGRPVKYLKTAAGLNLGLEDIDKIDIKVTAIDKNGRAASGSLL